MYVIFFYNTFLLRSDDSHLRLPPLHNCSNITNIFSNPIVMDLFFTIKKILKCKKYSVSFGLLEPVRIKQKEWIDS